MKRYFSNILKENKAILFNLPRSKGKSYYSIYALVSYLSKLTPQYGIKELNAAIICLNGATMHHNQRLLREIIYDKFSDELISFKSKTHQRVEIYFKNQKFIIDFFDQNYTLRGSDPDVIIFDEFFNYKEETQNSILNLSYRSKCIFNGTVTEKSIPLSIQFPKKVFNNMNEFHKRLSLNRKLKKLKNI